MQYTRAFNNPRMAVNSISFGSPHVQRTQMWAHPQHVWRAERNQGISSARGLIIRLLLKAPAAEAAVEVADEAASGGETTVPGLEAVSCWPVRGKGR